MNFLEIAKRKFPAAKIVGSGRWALQPIDSPKTVLLFESYAEAQSQVLDDSRVSITELKLGDDMAFLDNIPDREDVDERRRNRRERFSARY